jgi:bacterioferritin-associated ferredoxin
MYICVCRAVKDQHVRAAIEAGAHTVSAVTAACCAGDDCGACHSIIEDMIEEHLEQGEAAPAARRLPVVKAA